MPPYTLKGLSMKYRIKRKKGSIPKQLHGLFASYNQARAALRKYIRVLAGGFPHATHPDLSYARVLGMSIEKI
jgi:hypothetical protein